jgi:MFS transporter, DHA2 family, multidrug resistance protein
MSGSSVASGPPSVRLELGNLPGALSLVAESVSPPALRDTPFGFRIAVVCVMLGMFMQMLDTTIANVALPYMQGTLQASRDQITWVLTSYVIAAAILTGPMGWLSARFGRREIFLLSLVGFTVSSALCGLAQTLDQMIVFRLLQGAFGAALSPLSQAIILDRYPLEKRAQIMAVWSMIIMLGPILGPTLGGFLTDHYSWRWVFYVNVPVGIISTTGVFLFLHEARHDTPPRFDWFGFVALAAALAGLQLMLDRGTTKDWFDSSEIIIEAGAAGLGFYLFVVQIWTTNKPFLRLELLKDRNFRSGLVLTFFVGIILLATSALLPPYLQNLGGYSVLDTGLLLAPRGVGTMITMLLVGRIAMRSDPRKLMAVGAVIIIWSLWEMSRWTPDVDTQSLAFVTFMQGVGMGFIFVPSNLFAFSTLSPTLRTDGASIINLIRNVGSAIGVSVTSTALAFSTQTMYSQLAAHASPFNRALGVNAPSLYLNPQLPFGVAMMNGVTLQQATIVAYSDVFLLMFYISLPILLLIMTLPKTVLLPATAAAAPPSEMEAVE